MSNNNSRNSSNITCQEYADAFVASCREGDLDIAQFFLWSAKSSIGPDTFQTACTSACEHGHLSVLLQLYMSASVLETHAISLAETATDAAAKSVAAATGATGATGATAATAFAAAVSAVESAANVVVALIDEPKTRYKMDWNHLYQVACHNNRDDIVEWIVSIHPNAPFSDPNPDETFLTACATGNLEMVILLFNMYTGKIKQKTIESAFEAACLNGHVEVAKWLLNKTERKDFAGSLFGKSCNHGNVKMAKLIASIIDVERYCAWLFYNACRDGNLEIAKFLVDECGANNNSFKCNDTLNKSFMHACKNGHVEIAKWLLSTFPAPAIDISHVHHDSCTFTKNTAFSLACQNGHLEIVQWFHEMDPVKYAFTATPKTGYIITACPAPASAEPTNK